MKAKKVLKRLNKVEALLSTVIDQFPEGKQELGELLASAKADIIQAREKVNLQLSTAAGKGTPAESELAQPQTKADGGRTPSLAASKRQSAAKRKGINAAVAGRRLKKTA